MTRRKAATFRVDSELLDGLDEIYDRDGVPPSEQVRRAIRVWLEQKGVKLKPVFRRVLARRKL